MTWRPVNCSGYVEPPYGKISKSRISLFPSSSSSHYLRLRMYAFLATVHIYFLLLFPLLLFFVISFLLNMVGFHQGNPEFKKCELHCTTTPKLRSDFPETHSNAFRTN